MSKPKLGDLLVEANLIDEVQMKIALEEQKRLGTKFGSTLIALHFVDENVLTAFLSKQLDMPCVSLHNIEIVPRVLTKIPKEMALRLEVLPIKVEKNLLYVAMADPMDIDAVDEIERVTGLAVIPMVAPQSSLRDCLVKRYTDFQESVEMTEEVTSGFGEIIREVEELQTLGPALDKFKLQMNRIELKLDKIIFLLEKNRG